MLGIALTTFFLGRISKNKFTEFETRVVTKWFSVISRNFVEFSKMIFLKILQNTYRISRVFVVKLVLRIKFAKLRQILIFSERNFAKLCCRNFVEKIVSQNEISRNFENFASRTPDISYREIFVTTLFETKIQGVSNGFNSIP